MNNREAAYEHFMRHEIRISSAYSDVFYAGYQAALASQAAELSSNPLQLDTDSAREYLVENLLPKFSDSTFAYYVRNELAGDFAYQLAMYLQSQAQQHSDDIAVDHFAAAMKAKLAKKREQGRGGWSNKEECSKEHLQGLLLGHVAKGDPVDVGNFAMMLFNRGERTQFPINEDVKPNHEALDKPYAYSVENCFGERVMYTQKDYAIRYARAANIREDQIFALYAKPLPPAPEGDKPCEQK